jgi:LPXTG-motif cell wall-anchored protein
MMAQAVRDQWLIVLGIVAVLAALAVIWRSRRR